MFRTTYERMHLNLTYTSPQITGTIPVEFGQMVNLQELNLLGNKLTGAIVCSIIHKQMHLCLTYTFRNSQELFPSNLGRWSICKSLSSWGTI